MDNSPLARLPVELRPVIYEHVLGSDPGQTSWLFIASRAQSRTQMLHEVRVQSSGRGSSDKPGRRILALRAFCRQIRAEMERAGMKELF